MSFLIATVSTLFVFPAAFSVLSVSLAVGISDSDRWWSCPLIWLSCRRRAPGESNGPAYGSLWYPFATFSTHSWATSNYVVAHGTSVTPLVTDWRIYSLLLSITPKLSIDIRALWSTGALVLTAPVSTLFVFPAAFSVLPVSLAVGISDSDRWWSCPLIWLPCRRRAPGESSGPAYGSLWYPFATFSTHSCVTSY